MCNGIGMWLYVHVHAHVACACCMCLCLCLCLCMCMCMCMCMRMCMCRPQAHTRGTLKSVGLHGPGPYPSTSCRVRQARVYGCRSSSSMADGCCGQRVCSSSETSTLPPRCNASAGPPGHSLVIAWSSPGHRLVIAWALPGHTALARSCPRARSCAPRAPTHLNVISTCTGCSAVAQGRRAHAHTRGRR